MGAALWCVLAGAWSRQHAGSCRNGPGAHLDVHSKGNGVLGRVEGQHKAARVGRDRVRVMSILMPWSTGPVMPSSEAIPMGKKTQPWPLTHRLLSGPHSHSWPISFRASVQGHARSAFTSLRHHAGHAPAYRLRCSTLPGLCCARPSSHAIRQTNMKGLMAYQIVVYLDAHIHDLLRQHLKEQSAALYICTASTT